MRHPEQLDRHKPTVTNKLPKLPCDLKENRQTQTKQTIDNRHKREINSSIVDYNTNEKQ